jgi:tRNA (cmo5U34)-methyltransferase
MNIGKAFNDSIRYYDSWMKKALPNYDDLFGSAVDIIPFAAEKPIRVLDLGAGTGSFSHHILNKFPQGKYVLYDLGDKMLEAARDRFAQFPGQFEYIIEDYRDLKSLENYDLIVSSLSIHHLTDEEKQDLFVKIYKMLNLSGVFINIDQIRGETEAIRDLYWIHWLEQVRKSGASETQIQESIQRRTMFDKDALLSDQLLWMKNAGFTDVDCVYKNFFVGVFYGRKLEKSI